MQRRSQIDNGISAMVGLGCLVLLFKLVALSGMFYLIYYAIGAFSGSC